MAYISQTQQIAKSIADNYARGAEYLQKRHDTTIAAASELKANLAALPLNEAENEWRNGIVNAIDEQLNMIDINGFKGYGFNEIVKATGDIASSPAMIGRLQAQKDFTDFQNEIKARKDLTELDKEYFLTQNKYYYQDKFDDNGKIVSGTKWQPTERALSRVDFSEILDKARQWAAPDSQASSTVKFIDANGNETTDVNSIANAYYFNTITGESVYLDKKKIKEAIDAAIESTPGAKESLAQEYKIAVWAAENKGINQDVIGKDGMPISQEEYLALRTNPFIDAVSYKKSKYVSSYEETQLSKQRINTVSNGLGVNSLSDAFASPSVQTVRGGAIEMSTKHFKESQFNANVAKSSIDKLLNGKASINYNLNEKDLIDSVNNLFKNGTLDINDYDMVMANIRTITDAKYEKDHIFSDATGTDKERHTFIDLYNQGEAIDETAGLVGNRYNRLLNNVWKKYYGSGYANTIGYTLTPNQYTDFVGRMGGENIMKQMGVNVIDDGKGNKIVTLGYDNKENTGTVAINIEATAQNTGTKVVFNKYDENGNKLSKNNYSEEEDTISNPYTTSSDSAMSKLAKFILKQQDKENKYIDKHPVFQTTTAMSGGSLEEIKYRNAAKNDPENTNDYLKLANEEQISAMNDLLLTDFNQYSMQILDNKSNRYVDADGKDLTNLNTMINNAFRDSTKENKDYDIQLGFVQDELGNLKKSITIIDNKKKGTVYKYLQPIDNNSKDAISYKNDDTTIATKHLGQLNIYNKPIYLTGFNNISIKAYNRYDNSNENNYVIDYGNGSVSNLLNKTEVLELAEASVILDKMLSAINLGILNDTNLFVMQARNIANTYGKYGIVNGNALFNELLNTIGIDINQ